MRFSFRLAFILVLAACAAPARAGQFKITSSYDSGTATATYQQPWRTTNPGDNNEASYVDTYWPFLAPIGGTTATRDLSQASSGSSRPGYWEGDHRIGSDLLAKAPGNAGLDGPFAIQDYSTNAEITMRKLKFRFQWERNTTYDGIFNQIPDPNDPPPAKLKVLMRYTLTGLNMAVGSPPYSTSD